MLPNNRFRLAVIISLSLGITSSGILASPSHASRADVTLYAPDPEYPAAAKQYRLSGDGWFRIDFTGAGRVTSVRVTKSTGSKILDDAAIKALLHWRFKPGLKVHCANLPISFRP